MCTSVDSTCSLLGACLWTRGQQGLPDKAVADAPSRNAGAQIWGLGGWPDYVPAMCKFLSGNAELLGMPICINTLAVFQLLIAEVCTCAPDRAKTSHMCLFWQYWPYFCRDCASMPELPTLQCCGTARAHVTLLLLISMLA